MLLKLLWRNFKSVFSMKSSPDPFYVYILAYKGVVGGARIFDPVSHNIPTFFLVILMSNTLWS